MTYNDHASSTRDDQLLVLAFYIVIDVSYSMKENDAIGAANSLVPAVMDAITENPSLGDLVRVGVIDFSDGPRRSCSLWAICGQSSTSPR